jgi:hypothetical protein
MGTDTMSDMPTRNVERAKFNLATVSGPAIWASSLAVYCARKRPEREIALETQTRNRYCVYGPLENHRLYPDQRDAITALWTGVGGQLCSGSSGVLSCRAQIFCKRFGKPVGEGIVRQKPNLVSNGGVSQTSPSGILRSTKTKNSARRPINATGFGPKAGSRQSSASKSSAAAYFIALPTSVRHCPAKFCCGKIYKGIWQLPVQRNESCPIRKLRQFQSEPSQQGLSMPQSDMTRLVAP